MDVTEKKLLLLLQDNDVKAFNAIYEQYSLPIYRKFLHLVKLEEAAGELTQDLFVKIWEKRHLIDPEKPFRPYLNKIAENQVADFYRKLARDQRLKTAIIEIATSSESDSIEKEIIENEDRNMVHEAIMKLPPQQQYVFQLCKIEGHSYEEASRILGISTTTVRNHIVRANKTIKHYLLRYHSLLVIIIWQVFHGK